MKASTVRSACRRIERNVPRASSLCVGTITVFPAGFRSFRWLPRWLTSANPILAGAPRRRGRTRREGWGSRRDVNQRDDRCLDVVRERLILEVEFESLAEIAKGVLQGLALARDLDLQAACNVPGRFLDDGCGESHGQESAAVERVRGVRLDWEPTWGANSPGRL